MDIAKLSMEMSSMNIRNELSIRVMKMALDQSGDVGNIIAGMEAAAESLDPDIGRLLDISV